MRPDRITSIFIASSNSHEDVLAQERLVKFLNAPNIYHSEIIQPGQNKNKKIKEFLENADIIILVISADFLSISNNYSSELKNAIIRHKNRRVVIVPIIIRYCLWERTEFHFNKLQVLPKSRKPIYSYTDKDKIFAEVADEILKIRDTILEYRNRGEVRPIPPSFEERILSSPISESDFLPPNENFKLFLNGIDKRIKELIPDGIISPKENNLKIVFDSEKMLRSLMQTGIPLKIAISVLENVEKEITLLVENEMEKEIKTTHIRKIVFDILYGLNTSEHSVKKIQKWGNSYARKYGNPDVITKVIMADYSEKPITYKFLKDKLIPHIVEKCYRVSVDELRSMSSLNSENITEMAEEIMEKVKFLNLYAIDYGTLFRLAYNLAAQPPHPWVASTETELLVRNMKYNLEKASNHYLLLTGKYMNLMSKDIHLYNVSVSNMIRHAIIECIDHISSAILTHYRLFIGPGQLKPLNNMYRYLKLSKEDGGNILLWEKNNFISY